MATEDHDFEEINYFNFKGKKFKWNKESTGPVGRLTTEGLQELIAVFEKELGSGSNAIEIKKLIGKVEQKGYTLVPINLHFSKGRVKCEIGLGRGKKQHDKRDASKDRDWQIEKARIMRSGSKIAD